MDRLLPDLALKVVLSGLLDSRWGDFSRSTVVRFFVYGNKVKIGVGEGNINQWEIDALREAPIEHEWFKIEQPTTILVEGTKYVPGGKAVDMPRELIPVKSRDVNVFIGEVELGVFSAYRCFDINLGRGHILSFISPRSVTRDVAETTHPAFPNNMYRGRVNNVEVDAAVLSGFFEKGYGIGISRKKGSLNIGDQMEGFPILGKEDLRILLERVNSDSETINQSVKEHSKDAWLKGNKSSVSNLKLERHGDVKRL